jgi:hypothetical protein
LSVPGGLDFTGEAIGPLLALGIGPVDPRIAGNASP